MARSKQNEAFKHTIDVYYIIRKLHEETERGAKCEQANIVQKRLCLFKKLADVKLLQKV